MHIKQTSIKLGLKILYFNFYSLLALATNSMNANCSTCKSNKILSKHLWYSYLSKLFYCILRKFVVTDTFRGFFTFKCLLSIYAKH